MTTKNTVIILVAAMISMVGGFYLATINKSGEQRAIENFQKASPLDHGNLIQPPRRIGLPDLVKQDGSKLTVKDTQGGWTLWFFGYTHCPDICPATLGVTASAKRQAEKEGIKFPKVIFVSVDPERDTVKLLKDYVGYFDPDFIGVTGKEDMIKALTLQMNVLYAKHKDNQSKDGYIVDHSASLLVTNPDGDLVAALSPPFQPGNIIKNIQTIVSMYKN
jgi:protein SCO1/2